MLIRRCFLYVLVVAMAAAGTAAAQTPHERSGAAIVIFIDAASQPNIQPFDELQAGRTIRLGGDELIELGYFDSCVMEAIVGGAVTIGARESRVAGGAIQRETVDCANMRFQHGIAQLQFAAAAVFEKAKTEDKGSATGVAGEIASWSRTEPAVPDQPDTLVAPLVGDLDGRRRIAVLQVAPVDGVATAEAAAGARRYLVSKLRVESPHVLIADDQLTGLFLAPGDAPAPATQRRLLAAGAEVVIGCVLDRAGDEITLICQAQMVNEDIVVGHGALRLPSPSAPVAGTTAIVE